MLLRPFSQSRLKNYSKIFPGLVPIDRPNPEIETAKQSDLFASFHAWRRSVLPLPWR